MSVLRRLALTAFDIALSPLDVAKDAITIFGLATDHPGSYTVDRLKRVGQDLEDVRDEIIQPRRD